MESYRRRYVSQENAERLRSRTRGCRVWCLDLLGEVLYRHCRPIGELKHTGPGLVNRSRGGMERQCCNMSHQGSRHVVALSCHGPSSLCSTWTHQDSCTQAAESCVYVSIRLWTGMAPNRTGLSPRCGPSGTLQIQTEYLGAARPLLTLSLPLCLRLPGLRSIIALPALYHDGLCGRLCTVVAGGIAVCNGVAGRGTSGTARLLAGHVCNSRYVRWDRKIRLPRPYIGGSGPACSSLGRQPKGKAKRSRTSRAGQ